MGTPEECFQFTIKDYSHNRYNPLKGEWVLVSPQRTQRPWMGAIEEVKKRDTTELDATNPLCPGAKRANGEANPDYKSVFIFPNDFPALSRDSPDMKPSKDPLFQMERANGECRVMCYHPKSNVNLATMSHDEVESVVKLWIEQTVELGKQYEWVQIFENRGEMMGCSNPHPHCQIWASSFIPNEPRIKNEKQLEYFREHGRPLLMDYAEKELLKQERIVISNDEWLVVVPFWAVWPFETMILPRRHVTRFYDLDDFQVISLAKTIKLLNKKYDNLFKVTFPYSMGWHGAPTGKHSQERMPHWVFHGVYYPPLLRSATIKKFMVGYELLAQSQRDLTPEMAATKLASQSAQRFETPLRPE